MATTTANENLKQRLEDFSTFHPANAKLLTGWMLDPGDIVTVTSGETNFNVPIYQMDVTWKGDSTVDIQSSGAERRPTPSELKRRRYASGGIGSQAETDAAVEDVIYRTDFTKSDEGLGLLAQAVGVKIDPVTGRPAVNATTGKYEFDPDNGAALTSQINVEAGSISNRVTTAQNGVNTLTGEVDVLAGRVDIVVTGSGENAQVNRAAIILAINGGGNHSSAKIEADSIYLDGNVTLNGALNITQGELHSTYPISTTSYLKGGELRISDGDGAVTLGSAIFGKYAQSLSLTYNQSTSQYTLSWQDGTGSHSQNFSRATTLRGGFGSGTQADPYKYWSAGVFKVQADPQGETKLTSLTMGAGHWGDEDDGESPTTYYGTINATIDASATMYDTGKTFQVDASDIWQDGYIAGGGGVVVTPTINETWSSGVQTVTTTPTASNTLVRYYSAGTVTWGSGADANKATVPIMYASSNNPQATKTLAYNITVNASARYNAGWADAEDQVVPPSAVTTETLSFTMKTPNATPGGTAVSNTFQLSKDAMPSASGNVNVTLNGSVVGKIGIGNYYTSGANSVTVGNITGTAMTYGTKTSGIALTATASNNATGTGTLTLTKALYSTTSGGTANKPGVRVYLGGTSGTWLGNIDIDCTTTAGAITKQGADWWDSQGHWNVNCAITKTFATGVTSSETITINIDTPVSISAENGWTFARSKMVWPSASTNSSFSIGYPAATYGSATPDTKTFTVAKNNSYVEVKDSNNVVIARCSAGGGTSHSISATLGVVVPEAPTSQTDGQLGAASSTHGYRALTVKCGTATKKWYIKV